MPSDLSAPRSPEVINARLARYAVTRDARDLWPDVPTAAFRAAQRELARVIAAALSDAVGPVLLRQEAGVDARSLGVAAFAGGVGALVGYWCETGRVVADGAPAEVFATHLDDGRRRAARLRTEFGDVLVALAGRGIEVGVLKGADTAYRYFPEPGTRTVSDVDIFVQPEQWPATCDTLRGLGFREASVGPGDVKGMSDGVTITAPGRAVVRSVDRTLPDLPWSLDLHRSLNWTPFPGLTARLGTPDLAAGDVWHGFARPVRVLPQPLLLAYLAVHSSGHFYTMTLSRLVELVLVVRRDFAGRPDRWRAFDELVTRTGVRRFVFPALDLAERLVPGTMDGWGLERLAAGAPHRLRRIVRATPPAFGQRLHPFPGLRERFVWLESPREALLAFAWLLWPRGGERPMSPAKALAAQWSRLIRGVRRVVLPRFRR